VAARSKLRNLTAKLSGSQSIAFWWAERGGRVCPGLSAWFHTTSSVYSRTCNLQ